MKKRWFLAMVVWSFASLWADDVILNPSEQELQDAGLKIFQNETGGNKDFLVHWNLGEEFPSLGIGHFIWFPRGVDLPFTESFPGLIDAYLENGFTKAQLPRLMNATPYAPWNTREEFLTKKEAGDQDIAQLITFLYEHREVQVMYIMQRLEAALPLMMAESSKPDHVREQFYRVAMSPNGFYPLIDYVNFKGEGINPKERYKDKGWGLLQVLESMKGTKTGHVALKDFSNAAAKVLKQRIKNSPQERNEKRWQAGWLHRVKTYLG